MKKVVLYLFWIPSFICFIWFIVLNIKFDKDCAGYLEQVANANSNELALKSIDKAIKFIEENELTEGYTSILYRTESDNVGFWYENIKSCQKELSESLDSSQLEKSNILLKVRESLMTNKGELIIPRGITRYPHNTGYSIFFTISIIMLIIECIAIIDL